MNLQNSEPPTRAGRRRLWWAFVLVILIVVIIGPPAGRAVAYWQGARTVDGLCRLALEEVRQVDELREHIGEPIEQVWLSVNVVTPPGGDQPAQVTFQVLGTNDSAQIVVRGRPLDGGWELTYLEAQPITGGWYLLRGPLGGVDSAEVGTP